MRTSIVNRDSLDVAHLCLRCVSTAGQTAENEVREIEAAGFKVDPGRVITETVSGNSVLVQRPGFIRLLDRLAQDDVLIVTKMDSLGRNAMDMKATVEELSKGGARVHRLALGGVDLTRSSGSMTMSVLTAVAQFERDLLIERTQAGLQRAKGTGSILGRPAVLNAAQRKIVREKWAADMSVPALARQLATSRQTIMRARDAMPAKA